MAEEVHPTPSRNRTRTSWLKRLSYRLAAGLNPRLQWYSGSLILAEKQSLLTQNLAPFMFRLTDYDAIPRPTRLATTMITSIPAQRSRTGLLPTQAHSSNARPTSPAHRT